MTDGAGLFARLIWSNEVMLREELKHPGSEFGCLGFILNSLVAGPCTGSLTVL
jgi:hypothetical protein